MYIVPVAGPQLHVHVHCTSCRSTTTLLGNRRRLRPLERLVLHRHWFRSPARRCFVARWHTHRRTNRLPPIRSGFMIFLWATWWELIGLPMCVQSSDLNPCLWRQVFQADERWRWFTRSIPQQTCCSFIMVKVIVVMLLLQWRLLKWKRYLHACGFIPPILSIGIVAIISDVLVLWHHKPDTLSMAVL
jgi:hypothetical protein